MTSADRRRPYVVRPERLYTRDDLMRAEGDYEKLVGSIQERYGYAREQAEDEVNTWLDSTQPATR